MDIAEFVKARLDEDEAALNRSRSAPEGATRFTDVDQWDEELVWTFANSDRVQREIAAKRKILWDHTPKTTGRHTACSRCHYGNVLGANWPCLKMTSLAGIWSDHPDFDPKWTP